MQFAQLRGIWIIFSEWRKYLVAGRQESAGRVRGEAGLHPRRLGVVMDVVNQDTPLAVYVARALGHRVLDVGGAQVTLGPDPVAGVVRRQSLQQRK